MNVHGLKQDCICIIYIEPFDSSSCPVWFDDPFNSLVINIRHGFWAVVSIGLAQHHYAVTMSLKFGKLLRSCSSCSLWQTLGWIKTPFYKLMLHLAIFAAHFQSKLRTLLSINPTLIPSLPLELHHWPLNLDLESILTLSANQFWLSTCGSCDFTFLSAVEISR